MKRNLYYTSADGETRIHAILWIPEGEVRAVLQISHGMVEYIGRYERFAEYLNEYGICVVGNDHLGHGESVTSDEKHGFFKQPDGNECVIKDIHKLRLYMGKQYPNTPYFMLGHSMGSFLIRQYMMLHGEGLSGVIVMGTGAQPEPVLVLAKLLCFATHWVRQFPARAALIFILNVSGSLEIQPQNFASHYRGHSPTASAAALKAKIAKKS